MKSIVAWAAAQDSTGLRRWLQIGLGALWVLDGALQYQPYMFSRTFVTGIIDPAGTGSPAVVANAVTGAGHVLLHDVVLFNAAFATTQLAIGLGLLWRPAVKGALVGTMAWGLAVWLLGEGLGGILTGNGTPLTGAPGAAVLYVLLAVLIWPPRAPSESRPRAASDGPATEGSTGAPAPAISVADASPLGPCWSRLCWLLLWGGSAYLLLQAPVRAPGYLSSTIGGLADSEPGWLASIDRSVAHAVGSGGGVVSVVLAIIFLLVGVAVFIRAATRPALVLAALSAAAIWVLAENLGGILTGQGTDPNTGPLLILLAAAYLPCRPRRHAATESERQAQSASQPVRTTPDRELSGIRDINGTEGCFVMNDHQQQSGPSRRHVLAGAGAGLAAASAGILPGMSTAANAATSSGARGRPKVPGAPANDGLFGRIFPSLPPFAEASAQVRAALLEVGMPGGIMDAADDLAAGPKNLIVDPTVNGNPTAANPYGTNPDNPTMTAGSTFVGQFTDHDITFDQTSRLGIPQNPLTSPNTRTPTLDLDSVFGGGPARRPDLYVPNPDGSAGPRLKIGTGGVHEDVPRVPNGDGTFTALLGDPRDDENVMVGGLHCAHILFYNRVLAELGNIRLRAFPAARDADLSSSYAQFLIAREITLWHYQWLLVNEHLPQIAGQAVVSDVLARGNRFYRPPRGDAFLPIEFGAAAYRFGHSMVRPSYRANFTSGTGDSGSPTAEPFFGLVFDATEPDFSAPVSYDRDDLLGGFPAPRRYVGWQTFFDFGDGQVKNNKKIDTTISSVMFTLPVPAIAPHTQTSPTVLPQRNLLRQLTWSLPSGQAIAAAMGADPLTPADLGDIAAVYVPFGTSTPLWYYILAEARIAAGGLNLGPVGGRLVTETLIGLLRADPASYLNIYPGFRPFLGTDLALGPDPDTAITGNRSYTRAHFLHYAGVVAPGTYR